MGRFQGPSELFDGDTRRVQGERPFPGQPGIRERFLPDTRCIKVIRYFGEVGIRRCFKELFHRFSKRAMQRLALTEQQLSINGLTCQCMTESKLLLGFFHDQLSRNQLFHQREQLRFIEVCNLLEEGKIETPPSHSSQGRHMTRGVAYLLKPKLDCALDTAWDGQFMERLVFPHLLQG